MSVAVAWILFAQLLTVDPVARFDEGSALFAARDLAAARMAFVESVRSFEDEGRALDAALAREALARVKIEQGDWMGARETLDAAEPEIDALPPRHPHRARHVALRAIVAQGLGDLDAAEDAHERALGEYRSLYGNQHARVAAMLQNYATLTAARDDSLLTMILLEQALEIVERTHGADDVRRVRPLVTWSQRRLDDGAVDEARAGFAEADRIVCAVRGPMNPLRLEILRGRARVAAAADSLAAARAHLHRAGQVYEAVWTRGGADLMRATAFTSPFAEFAGLLARAGDFDAAWMAWESHVGRLADAGIAPATLDDLVEVLRDDEAFVGWVEDTCSPGPRHRWAFVVTTRGIRWVDLGTAPRDGLEVELRARLADFDDEPATDLARAVGARWFGSDLEVTAGVRHLVVVPASDLLGVPVGALIDLQPVGSEPAPTVVRAPSASFFVAARRRAPVAVDTPRLLALADPVFASGVAPPVGLDGTVVLRSAAAGHAGALAALPPLAATRDEVASIAGRFASSVVLVGEEASEARLAHALDAGGPFDVIHLATHALVDPVDPARSAMVLAGAGDDSFDGPGDGLLSLREILDGWSLDVDLVTLSACETGLGRATPTEGLLGFPFALLRVGARSVLVTAWKVDDRATALWMDAFYGAWIDGRRSKPEAVRIARHTVRTWENAAGRRPFADPAFWAAFGLVGE